MRGCCFVTWVLLLTTADALLPPALDDAIDSGLLVKPRSSVFVLGTVHIGQESANEADALIRSVKPDFVIVEASPSRVEKIRQNKSAGRTLSTQKSSPTDVLFRIAPALSQRGREVGGLGGALFGIAMSYSLLKKSFEPESKIMVPSRVDEFAAAVAAADDVGVQVIAADFELDELFQNAAKGMNMPAWTKLFGASVLEDFGLISKDPLLRRRGERIEDWIKRRRCIDTARSSKAHGQRTCPKFSKLLVDDRDDRIIRAYGNLAKETSGLFTVAIIVGLVHLDGVIEKLREV